MLVDNPLYQQPYLSATPPSSFPEYASDLNDIFDTELFNNTFGSGSAAPSTSSPGSGGSSPQSLLTTPPQETLSSFPPVVHDEDNIANSFFNIFEEDLKSMQSHPTTSPDFMGIDGLSNGVPNYGMPIQSYGLPVDMTDLGLGMSPMDDSAQSHGIDPQLVDTPSAMSDHGDEDSDDKESLASPVSQLQEIEKSMITIAPVKVGGHGKARKGTVQSGGVVKKPFSSTPLTGAKEKESSSSSALSTAAVKKSSSTKLPKTSSIFQSSSPTPFINAGEGSSKAASDAGDDDDDLPHDWRPSPEVFAKMSSKEKRQLRNKISARNFRIRRKEYISTLEGDIAERDRLLDHFRTQLGSRESENLALRQEIAALKKSLLDGRGGTVNLPPPAPLPEQSAAETLAASAVTPSPPLLTANTQKDISASPRVGTNFWGGVGMGGGVTPVHTTLVPDVATILRKGLQENINPALNVQPNMNPSLGPNKPAMGGFDGFADLNPFTMKTLDAYRMHLWGKMASQQAQAPNSNIQHPAGLAGSMRPHYFSGASSSKPNLPATPAPVPGSLSALLSGKHVASSYPTPPASPLLSVKSLTVSSPKDREMQQHREKEQQHAMLAAMASQTVLKRLGSAFWDAFTGGHGSPSSTNVASSNHSNWDHDKVQRVLEGKAILKVVDVEPATPIPAPKISRPVASTSGSLCSSLACDILEESMRSLTLGKKA
ncbi:hypothetical protein CPB83DRAFT_836417 [Crepidotus variabilis]|uniref:BZIP domain-containing protein n=1 Tax=Crepidotus variabilis TaxID=179855 RepID=A0A9P6EEM5_9AGAR|nr:hypothetical protein CPB83DRAFT_836417 [Crepidotus variabilis]